MADPTAVSTQPDTGSLLALPMVELLGMLRRRDLSAVDVIDACVARFAAVNPTLNALVADRFDAARQEAAAADREYTTSARPRPLLGIPFTVKEMIEVSGMPLTFGSLARRDRRAARDATVVARLRAAGAIPLGVTNVPEWGMWTESYNHVYGRTSNPHDPRHSPGGSSGGEGAAVGAGASVFGIGSDIGGSVRMPAAFCGVFGHKPTGGMLPLTGHHPVYAGVHDPAVSMTAPYVTIGTLTRSAGDIAPLMRAMAGRDGIDPNAEPIAFLRPDRVEWKGRRMVLLPAPKITRASAVTPAARAAVERVGLLFQDRGADVSLAPESLLERAGDIWFGALQSMGGPSFAETLGEGVPVALHLEIIRALAGSGRYSWPALFFCIGERLGRRKAADLRQARRELRCLARRYAELLGEQGVLICPVHPRTAPRHNAAILRPFDFLYTAVFNALRVPATSAPSGTDGLGLPLAVQFVSARGNDHVTVAAASVVEESGPAWRPAPPPTNVYARPASLQKRRP